MLKDLLRSTKFRAELAKVFRQYRRELLDIILFGSAVRGKERPRDIDILLLFKDRERLQPAYELRKALEAQGLRAEVISKSWHGLLRSAFLPREDILAEGWSWSLQRLLSAAFGYRTFMLFKYSLRGFSASKRMRFYYALEGRRGRRGALKEHAGIKFTTAAVLVPIDRSEGFRQFLADWGIEPRRTRILIPERVIKFMRF